MQRPRLSFWQILEHELRLLRQSNSDSPCRTPMSAGFSRPSAPTKDAIPILYSRRPLTGLIVQRSVGYFSDRTLVRADAAGTYFPWAGAICASLGAAGDAEFTLLWMAAGMSLDHGTASINVSMEPFRAFVGRHAALRATPRDSPCQSFLHRRGDRSSPPPCPTLLTKPGSAVPTSRRKASSRTRSSGPSTRARSSSSSPCFGRLVKSKRVQPGRRIGGLRRGRTPR